MNGFRISIFRGSPLDGLMWAIKGHEEDEQNYREEASKLLEQAEHSRKLVEEYRRSYEILKAAEQPWMK